MWVSSSDPIALGTPVPGGNELRASDAERDSAIGKLRDRFAEGRLSQETFLYRMDAALQAKFPSELSELFTDLPREEPDSGSRGSRIRDRLRRLGWGARRRPGPRRAGSGLVPAYVAVPYQAGAFPP